MIREVIYTIREGKKFHPIDVFQERWVITDGKDIYGENGEVKSMKQFKQDMKKSKVYNEWDHIYFPSEELAKSSLKVYHDTSLKVKKLSYV